VAVFGVAAGKANGGSDPRRAAGQRSGFWAAQRAQNRGRSHLLPLLTAVPLLPAICLGFNEFSLDSVEPNPEPYPELPMRETVPL